MGLRGASFRVSEVFGAILGGLPPSPGNEVQIVCPFHVDTRPSLRINLESRLWKSILSFSRGTRASLYRGRLE